jgi:hypothetical protein
MLDRQVEADPEPAQDEMNDAVERAVARDRECDLVRGQRSLLSL